MFNKPKHSVSESTEMSLHYSWD